MQNRKTSNTNLAPIHAASAADLVNELVPFDPFDEFVGSLQDPNTVTRDGIATVARGIFGGGDENKEFFAKLIESTLAVAESRQKIVHEQIALGGVLNQMFLTTVNHHTQKVGDTFNARRTAVSLALKFTDQALGIKAGTARCYMRCHQKFGDMHEAIRVFSLGELNILSAHDVTHDQITTIMEKKQNNPEMTRKDVDELLRTLQRQEEAIEDRDRQIENVQSLLQDSKMEVDVSQRANLRLTEELAAGERLLAEKQAAIEEMGELLRSRVSGFSSMEKDLADKTKVVNDLTAELNAALTAKPKVETKEVFVDKIPESYANVAAAVKAKLDELEGVEAEKHRRREELAALQADIDSKKAEFEAGTRLKRSMDELTETWAVAAGKMATVQLAIQASNEPALYKPTLEALSGMLRKYLEEIEAALKR